MAEGDTRNAVPEQYQGREQAYIKHRLLESYLEKLSLIMGSSAGRLRLTEICYVDCFAGPWASESDDLSDTSIGISLRILKKCQESLRARGISIRFRVLYVEKDRAAFQRLEQFLKQKTPADIGSRAIQGDFVELRSEILSWCGDSAFVFFFIDPKGWTQITIDVLRPLLRRRRSEFLINFMYDFINRTASMADWKKEISELLGEAVEAEGLPPEDREKLLLNTYRKNLKRELLADVQWRPRSGYVRVLDSAKERPKYHLVYLTTHPKGIVEFMEISEGIDLIQKRIRASTKDAARSAKTGIDDLFGAETFINDRDGHADEAVVMRYWRDVLAGGAVKTVGEEAFADMLEDTNWFPGDFQRALFRLVDAGEIENLDAKGRRPKKPLHWEGVGERLRLTRGKKYEHAKQD